LHAVSADDLDAPLGQARPRKRRFVVPAVVPRTVAGALGFCVSIFVLWAIFGDDPFGGEPAAVVSADLRPNGQAAKGNEPTTPSGPQVKAEPGAPVPAVVESGKPPPANTVTIIDGMSGKRQEVVIGAGSKPPAAGQPPAPARTVVVDPRLVEMTRHGPIPKIASDGARPADVYARPTKTGAAKPDGVRIAIVVTGLGIGASGTSEALAKLSGPVTLAFAPYGTDVERWVARARSEGHEVLLQVPMEPFDYPDNDPGPQTLLTSLSADQNIDRLYWLMSRFQGYVGITNYMGARFTATEQTMGPVVREAAKRGLIYFDDGSSPRSVAGQVAGGSNGAFARADMVLDVVATPADIDAALVKLEAMARDRGVAVGVVSALPVSIERIFQWLKSAEGRGMVLVPISAVANKPKSS
jgi:polysaccharide deacetylase 2 family uncharacterized protein YibQ